MPNVKRLVAATVLIANSMAPTNSVQTLSTLGKRKTNAPSQTLVLHLSSPEPSYAPSDSDFDPIASSSNINGPPILVNGSLVPFTTKRYQCTYGGCNKAYSKPTRLAEHERSHTGQVGDLIYYSLYQGTYVLFFLILASIYM